MKRVSCMANWLFCVTLCAFIITIGHLNVSAADGPAGIDAVLVLDASNSMNTSDPDLISVEAMKMFIDMLALQGDKVGVVSYTDQVERAKAMTAVRGGGDKQALKDFISALERGAYTDVTVGLDEAMRMMEDAHDPSHKPAIILLTDGNNELSPNSSKTLDDANQDTDRIIAAAQEKGYPIYTIGLNYGNYLNNDYLFNIASQTSGLSFEAKSAEELPDILSDIFADQMEIKIVNAGLITADGDFQTVEIDIPDPNIAEANITFLSSEPVEVALYDPNGNQVPFDDTGAVFSQSQTYALLKIISPRQGSWSVRVKGVSGDNIKINLLYHYSVDIRMSIDSQPAQGETARVNVTLLEGGQPTQRAELYEDSSCTVIVSDSAAATAPNASARSYTAVYQNGIFSADVDFPLAQEYFISALVDNPSFYREASMSVTVAAAPVTPTPISTPAPTMLSTPQPSPEPSPEPAEEFPWVLVLGGGLIGLLLIAVTLIAAKQIKKSSRVFTGKLVLEVIDHYTHERSAPQYRNLIEYGKRANLLTLLNGTVNPVFSSVSITPSPTAPSHLPQLIVRCTNTGIKIKKDFMDQDASRGVTMNLKTELAVLLEAENKQIRLRYIE